MPAPDLRAIHTFKQLVRYLEDELDWPLAGYDIEDLTFDYEPDELGLKAADAAKVKSIRQLRPLDSKQPWGIFFIEFDRKKLPVVVLRRILSHLVVKKRASANKADRAAWNAEDLLFISAFGPDDDGREITFAHFHQEEGDMPTLRVLGWDGGDTPAQARSPRLHPQAAPSLAGRQGIARPLARTLERRLPPPRRPCHPHRHGSESHRTRPLQFQLFKIAAFQHLPQNGFSS